MGQYIEILLYRFDIDIALSRRTANQTISIYRDVSAIFCLLEPKRSVMFCSESHSISKVSRRFLIIIRTI